MRCLFAVALSLFASSVYADIIPVTRWAGPPGSRPGTYEEWIAANPIDSASNYIKIEESDSYGDSGYVAVCVDSLLWVSSREIRDAIYQFEDDLRLDWYGVRRFTISSHVFPEKVRDTLIAEFGSFAIKGVLLVGNIQPAWFEVANDFFDSSEQFGYAEWPIDLFYSDLDGNWYDTLQNAPGGAPNGKYDGFGGDTTLEIYVGRLMPPTYLAEHLPERVKYYLNYFRKDHAYRMGSIRLPPNSLFFVDDDWVYWTSEWSGNLALAYPDTEVWSDSQSTRASTYRTELAEPRAWVSVFAHSSYDGHQFSYIGGPDFFGSPEYVDRNPPANFYNLFACSFLRYTDSFVNGATSIFNDGYGVGAVGSTKTGSMLGFQEFYSPLAAGMTMGRAFQQWFADYVLTGGISMTEVSWHYGMVIAGDPFLKPVYLTDVAATQIVAPVGTADSGTIVPRAKVKNLGRYAASFPVAFEIFRSGALCYADTQSVDSLAPWEELEIAFDTAYIEAGWYVTSARCQLANDGSRLNDSITGWAVISLPSPGWQEMADLPQGSKYKSIKDGGCLAFGREQSNDTPFVYAFKGNNTYEFYRYNTVVDAWASRESIPAYNCNLKKRGVKKGASLAFGTDGKVYATKGNNTLDWWQYDPAVGTWTQKADVPTGAKNCKEGVGSAAVKEGSDNYIYLLRGSGTYDFYRYNTATDAWDTSLPTAPGGASTKPYKNGSCIAYDGGDTIYVLKGSHNEFFGYSITGRTWTTKETLPKAWPGLRNHKKVLAGAGLVCYRNDSAVYALKGNNTGEFWAYRRGAGGWEPVDTIPDPVHKHVKGGGALASGDTSIWAFRGNNTRSFLRYTAYPGIPTAPLQGEPLSPYPPGANELLVYSGQDCASPKFSPDGGWVAFSARSGSSNQAWRVPSSGGTPTILTSLAGNVTEVCPSPDGTQVAFAVVLDGSPYSQIGVVPAGGGQATILTSSSTSHEGICWRMDGTGIFFASDVAATGCSELGFVPVNGGSEQILTSSTHAHDFPKSLSPNEVIVEGDDQNGDLQLYVVNVVSGQEAQITSGDYTHEQASVAPGSRIVVYVVTDQDGNTQIARVSADGGQETYLTNGSATFESPSITPDGQKLVCLRQGDDGSSLWEINVMTAEATQITDEDAERETPNARMVWPPQQLVSAVYVREGEVFRTTYAPGTPRLRVNGNWAAGNGFTNVPIVILDTETEEGPPLEADSVRFKLEFFAAQQDTTPVTTYSDWLGYRQDMVWRLDSGSGKYRITARYRVWEAGYDTSRTAQDSVQLDLIAPSVGSIIANRGRETLTCAQCTVSTAASDSGLGLVQMRLCDWELTLLENSGFHEGLAGWQSANVILDSGPNGSFVELDAPTDTTDTLVYLSQVIPPERFDGVSVWNNQLRLSVDAVLDSMFTPCNLDCEFRWVKTDTSVTGPDTMVAYQQQFQLPSGYMSWTGTNPYQACFMYNQLTPPAGYSSAGAVVRLYFSRPYIGGRLFIGRLGLDVMAGWMANPTHQQGNWEPYDSLKLCYMSGIWGKKTLHAQVQDLAGNVSDEAVSDTVYLPWNCPTCMQFNINNGGCAAGGIKATNMPEVLLISEVGFPPTEYADSMKVGRFYYSSLADSIPSVTWYDWQPYCHEQVWRLDSGEGKYRLDVRYMLGAETGGDTNLVLSDSCYLDLDPSSGEIQANRGRWFLGSAGQCTLATSASDGASGTGLWQMRFGDDRLSVLENSRFSQGLNGWRASHVTLDSGPGYCFAVLTAPGDTVDTLAFIEQPVSIALAMLVACNAQLRLSADVITESLATQGAMEFLQRWIKTDTAWAGPDTMEWLVSQTGFPYGSGCWTGMNSMSLWTQYNPVLPPPEHYAFDGLFARIRLSGPFGGGKVLLDNFGIQIVGGLGYAQADWQQFDSLRSYQVSGMPGKRTVHAELQDYAGNESQDLVSDTFDFDPIPPFAGIAFPSHGQIIDNQDSLVEVLGLVLDPPFPEDPMGQYQLSHFKGYKLCWKPATAVWGDSTYGILPESLFYQAALPPPSESAGLTPPWRHLAWWNTKAITDQYGFGHYHLIVTAEDSAGNVTTAQIPVQLDSFRSEFARQAIDSGASCIAMNSSANKLCVGFAGGDLVSYTLELDSISALFLLDSTGPVVLTGLAADSTGAVWVADARDENVKRYDAQGAATDTVGDCAQFRAPQGIAVARNGDIWVADSFRNVIDVYGADHTYKRSFGSTGTDTGQFQGAYAVALSYTNALSLALHFDPAGNPQFDTTRTTLVRCLVADKGNHRIQVFDTTGHYLFSFGDSVLSQPVAIATDTNGCCFVADPGNKAVYGFSPSGRPYLTIASIDTMQPVGAALSPDCVSLYALDQKTNSLIKYLVLLADSSLLGGALSGEINPLLFPKELILYQSRPNPATRSLTIRYGLPRRTSVSLKVYDVTGKLVRTLESNDKARPGYYNVLWNCRDNRDRQVAGGVYFYRLVTGVGPQTANGKPAATVKTRKLVIAK